MKRFFNTELITTGLAIFSMFFGAANLMFPIKVGLLAGTQYGWAISGFSLTAVLLPLMGLISIILFEGDYIAFFYRLGKIPGFLLLFFCVNIIGPFAAMPRIVTLSYTIVQPFFPSMSLLVFSFIFLACTFWATYKESKIIDLLGHIISPLLLISLGIIIVKGIMTGTEAQCSTESIFTLFSKNLVVGYQTLDLLGGIFFSAVIMSILRKRPRTDGAPSTKELAWFSFKSGLIGVSLLAIIYIGLGYIGAYCGGGLEYTNEGDLFSAISFKIIGAQGAAIIAIAVLMACFSTIVALVAVYAEFLNTYIAQNKLGYVPALLITLVITGAISLAGLDSILKNSGPIITLMYPSLIMLTCVNAGYKLFGLRAVKIPVGLTFIASLIARAANLL